MGTTWASVLRIGHSGGEERRALVTNRQRSLSQPTAMSATQGDVIRRFGRSGARL